LRARPFPEKWLTLIQRHVVIFHRLSASDRAELLGHIQVFLAEKRFEGCAGFEITDEVRLTIAAQACLLLLHRKTDYFPQLLTILVYPLSYMVEERRQIGEHLWEEGTMNRLGETGRRMKSEFASLRAADESGVPTLLDTYGATNPAEFFAVSVEAFFEQPHALRAYHPKLYAELRTYFQQDPVEFFAESFGVDQRSSS
jgi:Mlc titration factor MtfA (ptsG expression regulator)